MLEEEAAAEGNGNDHVMELCLQEMERARTEAVGTGQARVRVPTVLELTEAQFSPSEWIYVKAYQEGWSSFKKTNKEKDPKEIEAQLRAAGRKKGQAALLQAFKDKVLVPSTVTQDKEEVYGYEEYYADQWQRVREMQQAVVVNPGPVTEDGSTTIIKHDALTYAITEKHTGVITTTVENAADGTTKTTIRNADGTKTTIIQNADGSRSGPD